MPKVMYCFEDFVLDTVGGQLNHAGEDVVLRPKAIEVLTFLLEHAGQLAEKEAILEAVWPNVTVSDDSLAQCVLEIRKALGSDGRRLIRTVPRRGYIFTGPVRSEPADTAGPASSQHRAARRPEALVRVALVIAGGIAGAAGALAFAGGGGSAQANAHTAFTQFLDQTAIGQPLEAYPVGRPVIAGSVVHLLPGEESGWHSHATPLLAYVLDGTVEVDYGTKGQQTFTRGDVLIEAMDWPHNARNNSAGAASIFVVNVGIDDGMPLRPARTPR